MSHENTWIYRNAQLEESCSNGCIIVFNPTRSILLQQQAEAIAREISYEVRIYENARTYQKIYEAANSVYLDGFEDLLILTETNELGATERFVKSYFDFNEVLAFSEVVSPPALSKIQESIMNKRPLREVAPPVAPKPTGTALLLVVALNADPPVKGIAAILQEVLSLERNAPNLVAKYLPGFTAWDKRTVYVKIYLRSPAPSNSLAADLRIQLLANSGLMGLYNQGGVAANKINPPLVASLAPEGLFIPGNRRSGAMTKVNEFMDGMGVGGTIILAPSSQIADVANEFNINTVVPLSANFKDDPRPDLMALATALSNEYSVSNIAKKAQSNPNAKPLTPVKPTMGDNFILQWLHIALKTGGSSSDWELKKGESLDKNSKGYFARIWEALPAGDKEFLKDVGEGTGIGDIVTIVKSVKGVTSAANPLQGGNKKTKEYEEKIKKMETELGFGIAEVINDPRFKQLKSEFDLAD
jgi:hypothetical protein